MQANFRPKDWGMKHILVLAIAVLLLCPPGLGEIPQGFEVVEVTSGMVYHRLPRINNCGQIVFGTGFPWTYDGRIFLYDNGSLTQIAEDTGRDWLPDISDAGTIVWTRDWDSLSSTPTIWTLDGGEPVCLGEGAGPSINNLGHVAWDLFDPEPCDSPSAILFYDGTTVSTIIDDGLSNQTVRLNDHDEMVWTRYDFSACGGPSDWTSEIMLYSAGSIQALPSTLDTPQSPTINNSGDAAWAAFDALEFWDGEESVLLGSGHKPGMNDVGDLALQIRPESAPWETWLYRGGGFIKISDDPLFDNGHADINDDGEIVWAWAPNGGVAPSGIRLMRRIRNGDVDLNSKVDLADFVELPVCLTGPIETDRLCACRLYDLDHDRDVDLFDYAGFQNRFGSEPYRACCLPHDTPGCTDEIIEACVCATCPWCCQAEWGWDDYCVTLVEMNDCGTCP